MNIHAYDTNSVKNIHIKLLLLALAVGLLMVILTPISLISPESAFVFVLIYVQIEIFIALGKIMFKFDAGSTPKEITKSIVSRYLLYHLLCLVIAAIAYVIVLAMLYMYKGTSLTELIPNIIKYELKNWFIATNLGLAFGAFMFFLFQWQDALKREHKLKEEKLAFQFETLNNQVNPHFLFNSLNTLSSFISSKPDIAEKYVAKLASIYRYIIDNVQSNNIGLEKELAFIKDYFYLHQLRDEDKIQLAINIPNPEVYSIIPVSLQILIENALKHNMASVAKPLKIEVVIADEMIAVSNNLQKKTLLETSSKKGLKNLNERMKLSSGKPIEVIESRDFYEVKVPLISNESPNPKKVSNLS